MVTITKRTETPVASNTPAKASNVSKVTITKREPAKTAGAIAAPAASETPTYTSVLQKEMSNSFLSDFETNRSPVAGKVVISPIQTVRATGEQAAQPIIGDMKVKNIASDYEKTKAERDELKNTMLGQMDMGGVKPETRAAYDEAVKKISSLEDEYKALTGESIKMSGGKLVGGVAHQGVDQFVGGIVSALDFAQGTVTKAILGMTQEEYEGLNTPLTALNKKLQSEKAGNAANYAKNAAKGGKAAELFNTLGTATVAAIPQAALAFYTAGTSLAAQGTTAGLMAASTAAQTSGLAATVSTAIQGMAKNPQYWTSVLQTAGTSYDKARADGAGDLAATSYAIINSLINALVEVGGGGIDTLPAELRGGGNALKQWIESAIDEGKEEVVQGVIERGLENLVYGKDNPLISVTDESAIFNPVTSAKEFGTGTAVGGLLGGTQTLIQSTVDSKAKKNASAETAETWVPGTLPKAEQMDQWMNYGKEENADDVQTNKNGSTDQVLNMSKNDPQPTPEAPRGANTSADPTVPQSDTGVKNDGTGQKFGNKTIERHVFQYNDAEAYEKAVDSIIKAQAQNGGAVQLSQSEISQQQKSTDWNNLKTARKYVKKIITDIFGTDSVYFKMGDGTLEAYFTKKGKAHFTGTVSANKAAAANKFREIISKAEYIGSAEHDIHGEESGNVQANMWDYFVTAVQIGDDTVPILFSVRSIEDDVRAQIYGINMKAELPGSHGDASGENPESRLPNYGTSNNSADPTVSQNEPGVKIDDTTPEAQNASEEDHWEPGTFPTTAKQFQEWQQGEKTTQEGDFESDTDLYEWLEETREQAHGETEGANKSFRDSQSANMPSENAEERPLTEKELNEISEYDGPTNSKEYAKMNPEEREKATRAKKELRTELMKLFSTGKGQRKSAMDAINKKAAKLLENGKLENSDITELFDELISKGVINVEADAYYANIRRSLKGQRIYVNDSVISEFGDDWQAFKKGAAKAGIVLTTDHNDMGIDSITEAMNSIFGGFSAEADLKTQLSQLVASAELGADYGISFEESNSEIEKNYGAEAVEERMTELERKLKTALEKFAEKANLEISLKDKTDATISKERLQRQETVKRQQERKKLSELQNKTLKQLQWLKKNRNLAPGDMQAQFDDVLGNIDTIAIGAANEMNLSKKYGRTWKDLAQMYKTAQETDPNFLPSQELKKIVSRLDGDKIADMDIDALQDLYKAAVGLRTEYYNSKNVISDEKHRVFSECYTDAKQDVIDGAKRVKKGKKGKKDSHFFNAEQLTPMNYLQRMAGWNKNSTFFSFAKMLEKGERDAKAYTVNAKKHLSEFLEKNADWVKTADGQGKDGVWYEIEVPELLELDMGDKPIFGETVKVYLTPAQKVHMALESENYDNLRHMAGGRTFADRELYSKGKRSEAFASGKTVKLAPESVKNIVKDLTPQEQELYRLLKQYYNGTAKGEINRVSNVLYGYDKAMADNYAPIFTNQNYVASEPGIYDTTAEGVGHMKGRQSYSKNPTWNISALDAFERHVDQTSRFVGYSIPIQNMNTLMNYQEQGNSMRDVISHAWGKENGTEYIDNLIKQLQNSKAAENSSIDKVTNALLSNYVAATFGANPGIVVKQAASFPAAAAVMGFDTMPKPKQMKGIDTDLIGTYTPELDYRMLGYSTQETALLKNNPNWTQTNKTVQFLFGGGAITAMDGATVKRLWPWAENYVSKNYPELKKGTAEDVKAGKSQYYKKVAEVFNEAVTLTQPMYDEMHRANIMKHPNAATRAFTMFKTVPLQEYNTLRRAMGELQYAKKSGGDTKPAAKTAANAVCAILASTAALEGVELLNQLIKNAAKAYRDDDKLTVGSVLKEMGLRGASDLAGMMIGGSEIAEMLSNALTGDTWYGIEMPGGEQLNTFIEDISSAAGDLTDIISDAIDIAREKGDVGEFLRENGGELANGIKEIAKTAGTYLAGVPISNIEKYLTGTIQALAPDVAIEIEDFFDDPNRAGLKGLTGSKLRTRIGDIDELGDTGEEAVEELARLYENGATGVVPGVAPDGMTAAETQKFENLFSSYTEKNLGEVLESEEYKATDDKGKASMISAVYAEAQREAQREIFGAEYALEKYNADTYAKAQAAKEQGVDFEDFYDYYFGQKDVEGEKDDEGETISGSKKLNMIEFIDTLDISDEEKDTVYKTAGYNDPENAVWNSKYEGDAYEAWYALSDTARGKYETYCSWLDVEEYAKYNKDLSGMKAIEVNGEVTTERKTQVIDYINGLDMLPDQKSALFVAAGYAKSSLDDCPWYNEFALKTHYFPES